MVLSKVFIHLVFQGSSEDECQSMEASQNSVAVAEDTSTSQPSNPTDANPGTVVSPSQALVVATCTSDTVLAEEEASTTLGRSHMLDGSKGQFSREQCGGEPVEKQQGETGTGREGGREGVRERGRGREGEVERERERERGVIVYSEPGISFT